MSIKLDFTYSQVLHAHNAISMLRTTSGVARLSLG